MALRVVRSTGTMMVGIVWLLEVVRRTRVGRVVGVDLFDVEVLTKQNITNQQ